MQSRSRLYPFLTLPLAARNEATQTGTHPQGASPHPKGSWGTGLSWR